MRILFVGSCYEDLVMRILFEDLVMRILLGGSCYVGSCYDC